MKGNVEEDLNPDDDDSGADDVRPDCENIDSIVGSLAPRTKLGKQAKHDLRIISDNAWDVDFDKDIESQYEYRRANDAYNDLITVHDRLYNLVQ